jgi:hypothetical protein
VRLLLAHGIAQGGRNPSDIKSDWLYSLNKGLVKAGLVLPSNVAVDLPYFGDLLDSYVVRQDLPIGDGIVAKGGDIGSAYAKFRDDMVEEMRVGAGISDGEVQAEMGPGATDEGIQNWKWVQAIVRILDRRTPGVSAWTIERFLREAFVYIQYPAVQAAINNVVNDMLKDDTAVVVGHSLGSVVVYNILRSRAAKVPLLVTVGSPLGIGPIRKSLGPLKNPAGSKGWYNGLDPADIVALYPLDSGNFDVRPSITNNIKIKNWTENRHGIIGYLDDADVARTIRLGL